MNNNEETKNTLTYEEVRNLPDSEPDYPVVDIPEKRPCHLLSK